MNKCRSFGVLVATVLTSAFTVFVFLFLLDSAAHAAPGAADAKKIFNQRCTACHSYGHGIKVGPDLKGVTARRNRPWLLKFVRSSQTVIGAGDPVAVNLYSDFKKQRMPDWTDLSEEQIGAILDWFAVNGPEQKEPDERNAILATAQDLETARALFTGQAPLTYGGMACNGCHTIRTVDGAAGGTLGPDLTMAYLRYQDRAMTLFLKHPCFPRTPEKPEYLTPQESFQLKAYMRKAAIARSAGSAPTAAKANDDGLPGAKIELANAASTAERRSAGVGR
jgi:mono/diheme cytochrome c family protein